MPVMVIAHGSGGILAGREDAWAARLNGLGIATFVVDSCAARSPRQHAIRAACRPWPTSPTPWRP